MASLRPAAASLEPLLLVKQSTQPFGNRLSNERGFSVTELSDSSEGHSENVVVKNQDRRKWLDCGLEIRDGARESNDQFLRGHVMSTLGHAHGDAFLGNLGAGNSDEAEYNIVAACDRVHDEGQFFARPIGENGFKDEAFTLSDEFLSKSPSLVIVRLHPANFATSSTTAARAWCASTPVSCCR